ncbi:WD40-repeat-containing domain protein [Hygrophoropsis aurantiaca]|uniref:WD40-repeat-containing domain protein n=1 Tax=Hygrophoropsis aurantiaca TaxID=72124 RepID=A0ACB8A599_9AGAM|nr:WD40-repeat-containing domain protein [Hygrophoropsis aurantiaca]
MSTSASLELGGPASHLPTKVFKGHTSAVTSVAYLKDGRQLASGSWDGTICIWNVENGKQDSECMVHGPGVDSIAISPDERRLVSGGSGTTLWDLESKVVVWKTEEMKGFSVAFSPDGQLIAASHNKEVMLLDVQSGKRIGEPLQVGDAEYVWSLAFSPDGTRLAAGSSYGKVQVFDVATGKTVVGPLNAHKRHASSLVFTHDGQQIITASWDLSIRVWNGANGRQVGEPMLGHEKDINQIALRPGDGRLVASVSQDCTIRIWDVSTRRQLGDPLRAQNNVYSIAWSPDGLSIVTGDFNGNIYLRATPPHEDKFTASVLNTSSPPLPSASRSRANSLSSSILNLPAGRSPTPPQYPELNINPGGDDNWENSTNESFDSVLDLPADGNQPAQRRKRRRRRVAPVASTSPPPISAVLKAPPVRISAPRHSPPLDQIPSPPVRITPGAHVGALSRLWSPKPTLSRWNGGKDRKDRDEPHDIQPTASRFGLIPRLWGRASNLTGGANREPRTGHDAHEMQSARPDPISTLPANVPDMQLPSKLPRTPTSRTVKVSAAHGFNRTHAATSDEDDEVPCRDYICFYTGMESFNHSAKPKHYVCRIFEVILESHMDTAGMVWTQRYLIVDRKRCYPRGTLTTKHWMISRNDALD